MAMDCPGTKDGAPCPNVLSDRAIVCNLCGWEAPKRKRGNDTQADREYRVSVAAAVKAAWDKLGPSSSDLSDKQWYAVCKFWPIVAKRASAISGRPLAKVGPSNQLNDQVTLGPLFKGRRVTRNAPTDGLSPDSDP